MKYPEKHFLNASDVVKPDTPNVQNIKRIGRPPNTPSKWTPQYIAEVAADLLQYADDTLFPTEAEFCYTRGIHPQRLRESPVLAEARDMMLAKRQAMTIRRGLALEPGEGALGGFLARLAANAGIFSLVDKQELTGRDGMPLAVAQVKRVIVDSAEDMARAYPEDAEREAESGD